MCSSAIVMLSLETNFMSEEDKMVKDVDKSENPTQGYERLRVQSFDTGPQSGRGWGSWWYTKCRCPSTSYSWSWWLS